MENPLVIGRFDENDTSERAPTALVSTTSVPFEGASSGNVTVSVFRSTDSEDRGGVVVRIILENYASSFQPYAKNIADGVEIHVAGEIEGRTVVSAVKAALIASS
jgi:hypothetical protein